MKKVYPKPACRHESRKWTVNRLGFFQWDCLDCGEFCPQEDKQILRILNRYERKKVKK